MVFVFILYGCNAGMLTEDQASYKFFVAGHVYGEPQWRFKNRDNPDSFGIYPLFYKKLKLTYPYMI